MRKLFFAVCLLVVSPAFADDFPLMASAVKYHGCVAQATKDAVDTLKPRQFQSGSEAEAWAWRKVYGTCNAVLDQQDVLDNISKAYGGDINRMKAYRDGIVWSARAYVFKAVLAKWDAQRVM